MSKLKRVLAVSAGLVVGVVTLRSLRKRLSDADGENLDEAVGADAGPEGAVTDDADPEGAAESDTGPNETESAGEHATAAVKHAGAAVTTVVESAREDAQVDAR